MEDIRDGACHHIYPGATMELDCDRDLLRETLEEWDNLATKFDVLSTRLQARLDQFSAEHNIVPALDLMDSEPPDSVPVEQITSFLGENDLGSWLSIHEDGRDNLVSATNIASNLRPRSGDRLVEILTLTTETGIDEPQPSIFKLAEEELRRIGLKAVIDDQTTGHTRTVRLSTLVEDPLVDGFVIKIKLFGDPLEEDIWTEEI